MYLRVPEPCHFELVVQGLWAAARGCLGLGGGGGLQAGGPLQAW